MCIFHCILFHFSQGYTQTIRKTRAHPLPEVIRDRAAGFIKTFQLNRRHTGKRIITYRVCSVFWISCSGGQELHWALNIDWKDDVISGFMTRAPVWPWTSFQAGQIAPTLIETISFNPVAFFIKFTSSRFFVPLFQIQLTLLIRKVCNSKPMMHYVISSHNSSSLFAHQGNWLRYVRAWMNDNYCLLEECFPSSIRANVFVVLLSENDP